jgi:WD40 repeat protein
MGFSVAIASLAPLLMGISTLMKAQVPLLPISTDYPSLSKVQEPAMRVDNRTVGTIMTQNSSTGKSWTNAQVVYTLPDKNLNTTAFSPEGEILVTGGSREELTSDGRTTTGRIENTIKFWNLNTGEAIRRFAYYSDSSLSANLLKLIYSPDGQILASSTFGNDDKKIQTIRLWNLKTGQALRTIKIDHKTSLNSNDSNSDLYGPTTAFSSDGRTLVNTGSGNPTIQLWNVSPESNPASNTQESPHQTLTGHSGEIASLAFTPDSQILISSSADKTIKLWNLKTGQLIRTLRGHTARVNSLAISSDSQLLASGSTDKTIKLWNLKTGQLIHTIMDGGEVGKIRFSPDGKTYVTAGTGASFQVLDLMTDKEIQSFREEQFWALFSPNGQSLVVQGQDGMKIVR